MSKQQKQLERFSNDLKLKIATSMASGDTTTIADVMSTFDLSLEVVADLFDDDSFMKIVTKMSRMKAKMFIHTKGLAKLEKLAKGDDKSAIQAIKLLMEFTGDAAKKSRDVNVAVSLEHTVQQQEAKEKNFIDITPRKKDQVFDAPMRIASVSNDPNQFNIEEIEEDMVEEFDEYITVER